MSYSEEKMKVLNMVKEGKLTAEEAIKLLDALEENDTRTYTQQTTSKQKQNEFNDELNKMKERLHGWKKEFKDNFNQNDFDKAVEEITVKAEKIGKNVASATLGVTDRILDYVESFVGTNVFNVFGNLNVIEKTYEAHVIEGDVLDLQALNGNIVLKKHMDNTVVIKSRVRSANNDIDALQTFSSNDGITTLRQNSVSNMSASIEVYVPQLKFKEIKLKSTNGKIYAEDAISERFEAITTNGHIEIMGVSADFADLKAKNGKLSSSYVIAKNINMETTNGHIDIKHAKSEKLQAFTKNGRINVENIQNYEGVEEGHIELRTTNAPIKISFNDMEPRGYKVKCRTTNESINVLIPQLTYHNVNRANIGGSFIEAESLNYNSMPEKVSVIAESTNGAIEIAQ